ncbi:MAG: hypothetical protein DDT33_01407 [Firmicutes bacterium]|nr:MAG: nucleotidyltransferase domain-containing protein [Methanosarcinales archaeon Met12]MBT9132877.1 hypothetical protein [Bacillota bacterium]
MDRKKDVIKDLRDFRKKSSKHTSIERMIFFGSRAKGEYEKHSDIDLIIVSPKFKGLKFRKRPLLLYDSWDLDYPVDFLCYTPEEFEKKKKQITIVREAVEEGIEI